MEEIGAHYSKLGPLLLNDDTGAVTSAITNQHQNNAVAINHEILKQWLQGQGKQPVTWSTLLGVLDNVGLSDLAQMVLKHLNISETSLPQTSGETVTDMHILCQWLWCSITCDNSLKVPIHLFSSESHLFASDHKAHQPPSPQQGKLILF